jgi:hypothetical protein
MPMKFKVYLYVHVVFSSIHAGRDPDYFSGVSTSDKKKIHLRYFSTSKIKF